MTSGVRIGLFAALAVAGAASYVLRAQPAAALPEYGSVPAFTLTDANGGAYDRSALVGKLTVVDFIFTSCSTICPALSARMAELQDDLKRAHLGDQVRLLSISVDPERDTPERLRALAARNHADPALWRFVRGDADTVKAVVVDGMKQALERNTEAGVTDGTSILHSMRFVLLDREARIRGFYDATDPEAMKLLHDHLTGLAK